MRSRAEQLRRIAESLARVTAIILVAFVVWETFTARGPRPAAVRIDQPFLPALPALTTGPATKAHARVRTTPGIVERDWLVALRRAGIDIAWSDEGAVRVAMSIAAAIDPAGGFTLGISASDGLAVEINDAIGMLDSATVAGAGMRFSVSAATGSIAAKAQGAEVARAPLPAPAQLRPVLVLGSAGWESKFVITALEERGWTVHARLRVSPTSEVTQGPPTPIDTARYGAVVVLDSAGAAASRSLMGFVRSGGGLVIAGNAGRSTGLTAILPARVGALEPGSLLRATMSSGREGLPMYPLVDLRPDAVVLDRRDGQVVVAARRERLGRVIQLGEIEIWRWRMTGADDAPALHRSWWSRLVGSAARAGPPEATLPPGPEAAPYAALVHALGPPVESSALSEPASPSDRLPPWIGFAILTLLVAEWGSRRLRGAR